MHATLALEDGTLFEGEGFGAETTVTGEVVFNTSLTGYQEVITDPSYRGQMVTMTAAQIGNTGINPEDLESPRPQVQALIVREISPVVSNWRATEPLPGYLARYGIPAMSEVDTRTLTRHLRDHGALKAALSTAGVPAADLVALARDWEGLEGRDMVQEVTCAAPYPWAQGGSGRFHPGGDTPAGEPGYHVVAYDFGIKWNILRRLVDHGCRVTVVPAATTAADALALSPDGILLSNGPGDPAGLPYAVKAVAGLLDAGLPIFGICLGHQLLGQALGGSTYKLKFGHHGGNQPVRDEGTGQVQITAQNHNYAVDPAGLETGRAGLGPVCVTHWNLNDRTVEGMRLVDRPVFSVQYHPEASPGPHDANALFRRFVSLMKEARDA